MAKEVTARATATTAKAVGNEEEKANQIIAMAIVISAGSGASSGGLQ